MRASSLSDNKVIQIVSRDFVPVLYSVDDYGLEKKDAAERADWDRIRREAKSRGLSAGTVGIYLMESNGHVIQTMNVIEAAKPAKLSARLEEVITSQKLEPRKSESISRRS